MWSLIKKHKIWSVAISAIIVVGAVLAIWALSSQNNASADQKITETKARLGNILVAIENDGVVKADKAVLNFSQTGVLKELNVKVGDKVKQGDLLAELDSTKLLAQVDQAQATYGANVAKADRLAPNGEELNAKNIAVDAARTALNAETAIYNDVVSNYGVGSTQELMEVAKLQKAESDLAAANAQLAITRASYADAMYAADSSYANVNAATAALYDLQMTAPMNGVVTSVNGLIGQAVGGSQTSQSGFIAIADPESIMLVSQFDEEDITKITVGQSIKAEFIALNSVISGVVDYVSPVAVTDQNGAVTYEVHSKLSINNQKVLDGMSATVQFVTKEVDNVVVIPNKAVKRVDGRSVVSYYDENKKILNKPVKTGFTDGKSVAIEEGLEVGDAYLVIE